MIIFLDFDGVLHPEPCYDQNQLFCFLPRLEKILHEFPHVSVVVSSTWRDTRSLDTLRDFFDVAIRHRIIGATPHWRERVELFEVIGYQRQTEIEAWLRDSGEPWLPWIAIDDKPYLFRSFLSNLIKTESSSGFDENAEIKLRTLLAGS
ncbi:MAG: HAD domain-containing protein [Candidatus Aquirickettsiella gammari]